MKTVKYLFLLLTVAVSFSSCIVAERGGRRPYRHHHDDHYRQWHYNDRHDHW